MASDIKKWLGRKEKQTEFAAPDHLLKLAALLDRDIAHWQKNTLPPLGHWFFCQPIEQQSKIDRDGHIQRGDFIPPIELPRRMWASSDVVFIESLPLGENLTRTSTIEKLESKTNKSGAPLIFLTVKHIVKGQSRGHIEEAQHIVYKSDGSAPPSMPREANVSALKTKEVAFDVVKLFRFSALTFNAHRIHFDRDYAKEENYPALVVHGPYLAFLLLDHYVAHEGVPKTFSFRAESPLFDGQKAKLCFADNELWVERQDGDKRSILMRASISR
jgi:3-methylfumaryl-CoA hydratase